MATLGSLSSLNATATAQVNVAVPEKSQQIAEELPQEPQHATPATLPPEGLVLAESTAYRTVDRGLLSHTSGTVVKEAIQLMLIPGGVYQLLVTPPGEAQQEVYQLEADDWDLKPASLEQIVATVHTLKAVNETKTQVLLNGEFEGEDLPLYDIEIKWKSNLKTFLLHPNTPGAMHKRPAGQAKKVRLGFEHQHEAQEWYALLAIAMGLFDLDSPQLQTLPKALNASKKLRSLKEQKAL